MRSRGVFTGRQVHSNNRYIYVGEEAGNAVGAYDFNGSTGTLTRKQSLSTLPPPGLAITPARARLYYV